MVCARRVVAVVLVALGVAVAAEVRGAERSVRFPQGATATTLTGALRGAADATFTLEAGEGQVLQTLLSVSNRACYFNAFEPGRAEAAHIGSVAGNEFGQSPTRAGLYRFQIYLMRSAARRNETCRYRLSIELTGTPGGASPGVSDRQMRDSCQARVRGMYAVAASQVRMARLRATADGLALDGTVDKGREGVKRFRCLYTRERQLRDVMALTPDGE